MAQIDKNKLGILLSYIEENIRSTDQTKSKYIDPHGNVARLNTKQNQVIYGRRGSGKSLLIKSLKENCIGQAIYAKVNIEDYKDISFPDSILQISSSFLKQLKKELKAKVKFYQIRKRFKLLSLSNKIDQIIKANIERLKQPDQYNDNITKTDTAKVSANAKAKLPVTELFIGAEESAELKISKVFLIDKLNNVKKDIPHIKELLLDISEFSGNQHIYLVLDDFYFLRRAEQPFLADYFHRLSKDTPLYIKLATIRHRSTLYTSLDTYIGMEIGHDAQSIELDYTLDKFKVMEDFMWAVLNEANQNSKADIDLTNVLSDNAFKYLCIASGGVVRDFLSLFLKIGEAIRKGKSSIAKPDVIEIAIANIQNKFDALETDSPDEKEALEIYLNFIKTFLITDKKTNIFLCSLQEVEKHSEIKQALKELVDLRLLHQVEGNISAKHGGSDRYAAYMLDVGLYPGSRPRNFKVMEPGNQDQEGRRDEVRSAPKIDLDEYAAFVKEAAVRLQ